MRIKLTQVSKSFPLNVKKSGLANFKGLFKTGGEGNNSKIIAVDNINLEVKAKERVGVIGRNGSGKSTLLRLIAGIYRPNSGQIETVGNLAYIRGFKHGLKYRLTAKENIFLIGTLMGLNKTELQQRFWEIVEFSGLHNYLNTEVYKLSLGMQSRLASSIGLFCLSHKNHQILLIDEMIGGGTDENFKEKSLKKVEEVVRQGASVLLVSHNLPVIRKHVDRVIWMEKGRIIRDGDPDKVIKEYISFRKEAI